MSLQFSRQRPAALVWLGLLASSAFGETASAQATRDDAVREATDGFGVRVGDERTGLYTEGDIRGANPLVAGNARVEGLYMDRGGSALNARLISRTNIRVGLTAQSYPFIAPSGVVDYTLRPSAGPASGSFQLQAGSFGSKLVIADGKFALADTPLSFAGGIAARRDRPGARYGIDTTTAALIARYDPAPDLGLTLFWTRFRWWNNRNPTLIFPAPGVVPDYHARDRSAPEWAGADGMTATSGAILRKQLASNLTLRGGVFYREYRDQSVISDTFRDVDVNGRGRELLLVSPAQDLTSWSGEVQLVRTWESKRFRGTLRASVRDRELERRSGGTATLALGTGLIGTPSTASEPAAIAYKPLSFEKVSHRTVGLGFEGRFAGVGEVSLGVQSAAYTRDLTAPNGLTDKTKSNPILLNGTLAVQLRPDLVAYGSYASGLEDSGNAPETAVNYPDALPALLSKQVDLGVRWRVRPGASLVLAGFEIRKPLFDLDSAGVYRKVGRVATRGVELSLVTNWPRDLTTVLGFVLYDPKSTRDVGLAATGDWPPGLPAYSLNLGLDYRPSQGPFSVDANLYAVGERHLDAVTSTTAPSNLRVDLGARYRFKAGGSDALARVTVSNLLNDFAWNVNSRGALYATERRRATVSLTVDF